VSGIWRRKKWSKFGNISISYNIVIIWVVFYFPIINHPPQNPDMARKELKMLFYWILTPWPVLTLHNSTLSPDLVETVCQLQSLRALKDPGEHGRGGGKGSEICDVAATWYCDCSHKSHRNINTCVPHMCGIASLSHSTKCVSCPLWSWGSLRTRQRSSPCGLDILVNMCLWIKEGT
jgi:hypothetical protein